MRPSWPRIISKTVKILAAKASAIFPSGWTSEPLAERVSSEWTTTTVGRDSFRKEPVCTISGPREGCCASRSRRVTRGPRVDHGDPVFWNEPDGPAADPTWTARTPSRHSGFHSSRRVPLIFRFAPDSRDRDDRLWGFLHSVPRLVSDAHQRDPAAKRWARDIFANQE